jgi:hypothetical protein
MAKLTVIVTLETTEEYDSEAQKLRVLRNRDENVPTKSMEFGEQISLALGGLRYVEKNSLSVMVTTVTEGHHSKRVSKCAVPAATESSPLKNVG